MVEKYTGTPMVDKQNPYKSIDSGMFEIENKRIKKTTDKLKAMIRDTKELVATSVDTEKSSSQLSSPKPTKESTMEDWRHPDHGFKWGEVLCNNLSTLREKSVTSL